MIGNSLPEYIFIRCSIAALRLISPASFLYVAIAAYTFTLPISGWIASFACLEVVFFLLIYLPRRSRFQVILPYKPPLLPKAERQALFAKCCRKVSETQDSTYPGRWFLPGSNVLLRQDVAKWIAWAFFNVDYPKDFNEEWAEELDEYVDTIEGILGQQLGNEDGLVGAVGAKSMRPRFDPVKTVHRPLMWYMIIHAVDTFTSLVLAYLGFKHYSSPLRFQTFPSRPALSFLSRPSCLPNDILLPYWYRPHKSPDKLPILFIHGIGVGLFPYIPLFHSLIAQDPDIGIILLEFLPISTHMTDDPVLPRPVLIKAINTILDSLGISRVVVASNSFGTAITAQMILPPPPVEVCVNHPYYDLSARDAHLALQHKISHVLLIDPIPILMHFPDVAYNFLYREPREASQWLLWFFASTDADVARTLGRAFFWEECALWKEDLKTFMKGQGAGAVGDSVVPNGPITDSPTFGKQRDLAVVLAGKDQIVPAETVRRYLTGDSEPSAHWRGIGWAWSSDEEQDASRALLMGGPELRRDGDGNLDLDLEEGGRRGGNLDVLFYPKLDHAAVFGTAERRRGMLDVLYRFVRDV